MMNMHSKYNNMHRNKKFNALVCVNNHINTSISCMLSISLKLYGDSSDHKETTMSQQR